ncbi:MAG: phosphoribosylaminoimidazolesuccinocarboxamide synthase [Bacteroidia bacterium]|nr:phosphoribosylaminoimidazolesuccinocarboxamide synthase [Bacteroidia bacterium]MCX7763822.1 phosphoribosylaminoimidazolesuccinocarboxamide synthase [Bacteroidia bacterium]MDW8056656.1 phosphoribosylaminoimidazolesuccinocarboxamide synthase [Bacteroidia bacterium]
MQGFYQTNFQLPKQTGFYRGKVRDVYEIEHEYLLIVTTDRISAFDTILSETIPHKGQVLTGISDFMFRFYQNEVPSAWISTPDPNVLLMRRVKVYPVEVIIRRCLVGYAWRLYRTGGRLISGVRLPDGLIENDILPEPILTPTTKSIIGHDVEISEREIVESGLVPRAHWDRIREYAFYLFKKGIEIAERGGMLLCDAKYEFGTWDGEVLLADEVHTPDSARYLKLDGYYERQARQDPQIHLTKEYVREWLMRQGFQGQPNATPPPLPPTIIQEARERYIEVYQRLTGETFQPRAYDNLEEEIRSRCEAAIESLGI